MSVHHIPEGFHAITPTLCVDNATNAIEFYQKAFAAEEVMPPMLCPQSGKVLHAELRIGDSIFFVCDEFEAFGTSSPKSVGGSPSSLFVYYPDCDEQYRIAMEAGSTSASEPVDMFWGDRLAMVVDPFGYKWTLATHKEDLTPEEIGQRMQAAFSQQS